MTRHFPKHRKESVAELVRRVRRGYPIGLGQFARHMSARRVSTPDPWAVITRHLQFTALLVLGLVAGTVSIVRGGLWPLFAWVAMMLAIYGAFAMRARSLVRPAYYFLEWSLTSPFVVWGLLKRPRAIGEFSNRHPLPTEGQVLAPRRRILREFAAIATLLVTATTVAAIGAEMMTRLMSPQLLYRYPRNFYQTHPTRGYTVTPGFRATVSTPEYSVTYAFTGQSFRGDKEYAAKPAGTFRIVVLGDSFTMGAGVEEPQTFSRLLEANLREGAPNRTIEVVNTGIPGYGTREESILFAENVEQLAPDLVILSFFVGNDLNDNARPGLLKVIDGELVESKIPDGFLPLSIRGFLSRHSHLYHLVWPYKRMLMSGQEAMLTEQRSGLAVYGTNDTEVARLWPATQGWIGSVAQIARAHHIPLAIVLIPDPLQVDARNFDELLTRLGLPTSDYDRHRPNDRLVEIGRSTNIPVLDLLPAFERVTDPSHMYFPLDKHWNAAGHGLAADEIVIFLRANRVVP